MSTRADPELSDLDMLDDTHRHARCVRCHPPPGPLIGVPFVALCGRRAINLREWNDPMAFPPDACPECVRLWDQGCRTCP